ncbi:unnamed protein product, partial [Prorocentrum cordatum]
SPSWLAPRPLRGRCLGERRLPVWAARVPGREPDTLPLGAPPKPSRGLREGAHGRPGDGPAAGRHEGLRAHALCGAGRRARLPARHGGGPRLRQRGRPGRHVTVVRGGDVG